jgi:flagellar motor switch protein FliN/FliY
MADQTPNSSTSGGDDSATVSPNSDASAEAMAVDAIDSAAQAAASLAEAAGSQSLELPSFAEKGALDQRSADLELLDDVTLKVKIELGRTQMYVEDVLRLAPSSVVELDKAAGDPVDIFVNDRHVARGEVLVLNESFCVRVSEIIQQAGMED